MADAIFFAAHSQGCIATTHLISRLIAQGHIRTPYNAEAVSRCEYYFGHPRIVPPDEPNLRPALPTHSSGSGYGKGRGSGSGKTTAQVHKATTVPITLTGAQGGYQRVCMLAMCGVHLGPLYSINTSTVIQPYLHWFENAAAKELFEFQESTSAVSVAYQRALAMCLENDVRVVLLSSMNDQVVSASYRSKDRTCMKAMTDGIGTHLWLLIQYRLSSAPTPRAVCRRSIAQPSHRVHDQPPRIRFHASQRRDL